MNDNMMINQVAPDWVSTFSGGIFHPLEPRVEEVVIEDIAQALSNTCRYNGHVREFYSVAQHSVLVAENTPDPYKLHALLHDASEAYIADITRPIKHRFYISRPWTGNDIDVFADRDFQSYKRIEERLMKVIFEALGVTETNYELVHLHDNRALETEMRDLMSRTFGYQEPYPEEIIPWTPSAARDRFLKLYRTLRGE